jgi:hypothetical protein
MSARDPERTFEVTRTTDSKEDIRRERPCAQLNWLCVVLIESLLGLRRRRGPTGRMSRLVAGFAYPDGEDFVARRICRRTRLSGRWSLEDSTAHFHGSKGYADPASPHSVRMQDDMAIVGAIAMPAKELQRTSRNSSWSRSSSRVAELRCPMTRQSPGSSPRLFFSSEDAQKQARNPATHGVLTGRVTPKQRKHW